MCDVLWNDCVPPGVVAVCAWMLVHKPNENAMTQIDADFIPIIFLS